MTAHDVSLYYDELHRWTEKDRSFQTFSGLENDTIHRLLIDSDTGEFSPDTIYKFIDSQIAAARRSNGALRGLDAGCGYGGTCFHCLKLNGDWVPSGSHATIWQLRDRTNAVFKPIHFRTHPSKY